MTDRLSEHWPDVSYPRWSATCDTLHAHTQTLGKLCVSLAPPEPQLQHAALRLTARGWETNLLPAPDGSGGLTVALDLRTHRVVAEHTSRGSRQIALWPDRPVGHVTRELLEAVADLAGPVFIDPRPQEVPWTVPLDEDEEHSHYDPPEADAYFQAATQAALVLAAFRAPYRGRSTPVNAWWGSFDLATSLFSGRAAEPPSTDFIMRNSMDAQEVAVGWWPGNASHERAAFYAYAHPAEEALAGVELSAGGWDAQLGEFILDWDDVRGADDPHGVALHFAQEVFRHACSACDWDPALAASADAEPPPVR